MNTKSIFAAAVLALSLNAYAAPSDAERIEALERQVARLTEQVNVLLAERAPSGRNSRNDQRAGDGVYVCKISAFTDSFRAENVNRGRAKLDVLRQCSSKHHEMFCRESDVRCETYR